MSVPTADVKHKKLSTQALNAFSEVWTEAVSDIPLPTWCSPDELSEVLCHETAQYYIEKSLDDRYERILKQSRNVGEAFIMYSDALTDYSKAMMGVLREEILKKPKSFYRSDFPLTLLTKLDLLKHTQIQAYDFLWRFTDSFLGKASLYKGNSIKFRNKVEIPSSEKTHTLVDSYNNADKASGALLAYIRIWNVSSYDELLEDKPLSKEKLDPRTYADLYEDFDGKLYSFRNTLLHLTPETYSAPVIQGAASRMLGELQLSGPQMAATES
jgi:hypothetical protein